MRISHSLCRGMGYSPLHTVFGGIWKSKLNLLLCNCAPSPPIQYLCLVSGLRNTQNHDHIKYPENAVSASVTATGTMNVANKDK